MVKVALFLTHGVLYNHLWDEYIVHKTSHLAALSASGASACAASKAIKYYNVRKLFKQQFVAVQMI